MSKIKTIATLALALGLCPLSVKAMDNGVVSIQNERKYENCVVSAEDEKNFIEKLQSELLEYFSKGVDLGEGVQINYEMEYACVKFDEIKEKCNSLGEAKKYLLRQIFDLALDFYFSRPDLMGPMASEEDLKNYQIVKNWDNEKIDSILSNIDMRDCKFSEDVEQSITKIFGRRS
jgi:hypothetical protein